MDFSERQRTQSATVPEQSDDESDTGGLDSDALSIASVSNTFNRPYSPFEDSRSEKQPRLVIESPLDQLKASTSHFPGISVMKADDQSNLSAIATSSNAATSSFPYV